MEDIWCLHVLILCALRGLVHQLWNTYSNMLFLNHTGRGVSQQGIDFEQIDNGQLPYPSSDCWIVRVLEFPFPGQSSTPGCKGAYFLSHTSYNDLRATVLLDAQILHSPHLFPLHHWHHHESKDTHPFTAGHATLLDYLLLCVVVGIPTLGTAFIGYGSISVMYGYILAFDFLRCLGYSNVEIFPHSLYQRSRCCRYHSLYHQEMKTSFCLFMPLYDMLGNTLNSASLEPSKRNKFKDNAPHFVFLAHIVDIMLSMHAPFLFRLFLLPIWPFAFVVVLGMWLNSKTLLCNFYSIRGRLNQTRVVPRAGFQYFLPFAAEGVNKLIEEAILRAGRSGTLFVNKHPNLKIRMVHGNTFTAAVILNEIPRDVNKVFLSGATSKLGRAIALYLARRRVRVLMLTQSSERFMKIQREAPVECQKYLVQTWIIGKWSTPREQSWAPSGTHFYQFVVPPIITFRRDCIYGQLAAMRLPKDVTGVGTCEYSMGRGIVHACHAGGLVHLLKGWTHHEVGAIEVDQTDVVWEAALKHGLKPLYNSR
ncbi:unnamed protein product [Withania somnifera]